MAAGGPAHPPRTEPRPPDAVPVDCPRAWPLPPALLSCCDCRMPLPKLPGACTPLCAWRGAVGPRGGGQGCRGAAGTGSSASGPLQLCPPQWAQEQGHAGDQAAAQVGWRCAQGVRARASVWTCPSWAAAGGSRQCPSGLAECPHMDPTPHPRPQLLLTSVGSWFNVVESLWDETWRSAPRAPRAGAAVQRLRPHGLRALILTRASSLCGPLW